MEFESSKRKDQLKRINGLQELSVSIPQEKSQGQQQDKFEVTRKIWLGELQQKGGSPEQ